eukprot:1147310-Pelagomonas_calceolata.AAC.6
MISFRWHCSGANRPRPSFSYSKAPVMQSRLQRNPGTNNNLLGPNNTLLLLLSGSQLHGRAAGKAGCCISLLQAAERE